MKKIVGTLSFAILILWVLWANIGYEPENLPIRLSEVQTTTYLSSHSNLSSRPNLVAIQLEMYPEDYANKERFYNKLNLYFQKASQAGFLKEKTIVLLPEYTGTWLVVANEKASIYKASSLFSAMVQLVLSNPISILAQIPNSLQEEDPLAAAIFRSKSSSMAFNYSEVFKQLASQYKVAIIPGSIVLAEPRVQDNTIQTNPKGKLYNSSFVFYPNGIIDPQVTLKKYPIDSELKFIQPALESHLFTYQIFGEKVAILICADSWYPDLYDKIKPVNTILVPSYSAQNDSMSLLWSGYNGFPDPKDVLEEHKGKILEKEAWFLYSLPGRLPQTKAQRGVITFLRGNLWDLGSDGNIVVVDGKKSSEVQTTILNYP